MFVEFIVATVIPSTRARRMSASCCVGVVVVLSWQVPARVVPSNHQPNLPWIRKLGLNGCYAPLAEDPAEASASDASGFERAVPDPSSALELSSIVGEIF